LSQNAKASDVPAGAQVENLNDIAERMGHPEYAGPFPLPATAVYSTPRSGMVAGAPGEGPNQPASKNVIAKPTTQGDTTKPPARPSGAQ
jgi:hypothetical protein